MLNCLQFAKVLLCAIECSRINVNFQCAKLRVSVRDVRPSNKLCLKPFSSQPGKRKVTIKNRDCDFPFAKEHALVKFHTSR